MTEYIKEITTPTMENGKCKEHCSHKDDMGFCLAGDACIKYGVNNVTGEPINRPADEYRNISYAKEAISIDAPMSVIELNQRLGYQMRNLMDRSKSEKDHRRDLEDSLVVAALSKTIIQTISMAANMPKMIRSMDRESRDIVKGLLK